MSEPTKVFTAHIPLSQADRIDQMAEQLEHTRAWVMNRPKIIGGRMDWIRQLCLIRRFGDSTPLQILLAECSRWNSAVGAG